jgi:hypothetical protein
MKLTHRHQLLRGSSNNQKLTFEFLFFSMAKNIPYIFLALQLLNIFGVVNFNINPDNFPSLSILGELGKFKEMGFNPFLIYWHFITIFFLVVKSVTLTFISHIQTSPITAGIVAIIVANIFLLYRSLSYGAARENWNRRSILKWMFSDILKEGNLLEDALFMMFVVDIIVFVVTPETSHLYFLIAVYLVMLSIKVTPIFANLASNMFNAVEQSFFHNEKVLFIVTLLDIVMIYFDSQQMLTLFLLILAYTAIATIILRLTKKFESANEVLYYVLYLGLLIFYLSIAAILAVSLIVVILAQIPIIIGYYLLKKKLAPGWLIQAVNGIFLVILLIMVF